MTYPEAINYLEGFIDYERIPFFPYKESLKLERIRYFLDSIHNPQESLRCLHIAGSKGKGSTCVFLTYILREAGFQVGLYTSPHLSDFRERIRVLKPTTKDPASPAGRQRPTTDFEGMISRLELTRVVERLKPAIEKFNAESTYGPLTFFEVYTALALVYFQERKVDFAVLETGLGGRLDATNTVTPLVCAITPISHEHTQKLGNTLREIATEKCGIIKSHGVVISAPQEAEVQEVIRDKCKEMGARLVEVKSKPPKLKTKLIGRHQLVNAAVALAAAKALGNYNIKISRDAIRRGLAQAKWPGRCEVISKKPFLVLDGAQNVASAQALRKAIKEKFSYKKLILVLGISSDKDIAGICKEVCPLAETIILTQANNPRAADVNSLEKVIREQITEKRLQIVKTKDVKKARVETLRLANKEDLILVTGSLFVVGEFRNVKI